MINVAIKKNNNLVFHIMLLPSVLFLFVYNYLPMFGVIMSFQKFSPKLGFINSPWVGLENYRTLLMMPDILPVVRNTMIIALYKIIGNLIVPVIFALLLNEVRLKWFKKTVQTITYLPYFLSWVVLAGVLLKFLAPGGAGSTPGFMNTILIQLRIIEEPLYFLGSNTYFRATMVISDIWKGFGFNTIVYLAALTSIDPSLYEAASVDGAGKLRQTWNITLPGISQFIALMTILSIGNILNAGFEQIFNLYTPAVYETGDIVDTLVYRLGLVNKQYSLSAAVGLFKSVISVILVTAGYKIADKYTGYRVF